MRNSQAQRYARWSATAAGVLAAIVAGIYLHNAWLARQAEKKAPPAVPPTIEQRSNEFSFSKVEGQRTIYTVHASRTTEFKEGSRNLLEDVSITVYGQKGERNDKLSTKACDFISDTGKISCAGEVQMNLLAAGAAPASAIQVVTSGVAFDQHSGEAHTDKPVNYRWPAGDGKAVGARYDSSNGALYLNSEVAINISVSSPGSPGPAKQDPEHALHLTGNRLEFHRDRRTVLLQGEVHAQQTTYELSSEQLLLELDASLHAKELVADGRPQLRDADAQSPISLVADEISAELRPDGSVDSILATGNVQGSRNGPTDTDIIDAAQVKIDLATRQNEPRLLTASGGVVLTSRASTASGGTRRVASEAVEIHFAAVSKAGSASETTRVDTVNTLAPARAEWQNVSTDGGKATPQKTVMNGERMILKFGDQNQLQQLVGSGGVDVTRRLGDGPEQTTTSRELTANFDGTGQWSTVDQVGDVQFHQGPRNGKAQRAHLDRATDATTLTGSVTLADETTRTTAQSAVFIQDSNILKADGNVLTTELQGHPGPLSSLGQETGHVSADHLTADTARAHAVYAGNARLWQGPSEIEGDTIELDNPTRVLIARGRVRGVFPQSPWSPNAGPVSVQTNGPAPQTRRRDTELAHVSGGLLTYWDTEARARVEQNARADSVQGSIQADQIDLFFSTPSAESATRQLSRALASGDVNVHQDDRKGTSNEAEYTASEGKFVLSGGKPTLYDSTGDTTEGRQLTFYFADDRIVVDSAEGTKTVTLHRVEK